MIRLTVALCMDAIPRPGLHEIVPHEPLGQRGEALESLVPAGRPAVLEDDDQRRWAHVEIADQLGPQGPDRGMAGVVEEMKAVEEARRLAGAEAQQGVDAAGGRVEDL